MTNEFQLQCAYDKIWQLPTFIGFLALHQNQNIVLTLNPEAIDLRLLGLYDLLDCFTFKSVTIHTYNPFEAHDRYKICISSNHIINRYVGLNINPELHIWNQSKVFMTMYGRPSAARLVLSAHLFEHHRAISNIHLKYDQDADSLALFEINKLCQYSAGYVELVGKMIKCLPLHIASSDHYTPTGYEFDKEIVLTYKYQDVFVDIVGETFVDGKTFLPTEKIFRCMLLKKPFIVYGSENFLLYLRQMGFQTFYQFWDEDYDGYQGKERLSRILKLIDNLADTPTTKLNEMLKDMQKILDHNYNVIIKRLFTTTINLVTE